MSLSNNYYIQDFWVRAGRVVSLIYFLILVAETLYCLKHKVPFAVFILLSLFFTFTEICIYTIYQFGLIPYFSLLSDSFNWRVGAEISVMSIAAIWQFKMYKEKSEILMIENNDRQLMILNW